MAVFNISARIPKRSTDPDLTPQQQAAVKRFFDEAGTKARDYLAGLHWDCGSDTVQSIVDYYDV